MRLQAAKLEVSRARYRFSNLTVPFRMMACSSPPRSNLLKLEGRFIEETICIPFTIRPNLLFDAPFAEQTSVGATH